MTEKKRRIVNLKRLSELPPNWDSYGAKSISASAIAQAEAIVAVPMSDGGVQLELHRNGDDLEIVIGSAGHITGISWEGRSSRRLLGGQTSGPLETQALADAAVCDLCEKRGRETAEKEIVAWLRMESASEAAQDTQDYADHYHHDVAGALEWAAKQIEGEEEGDDVIAFRDRAEALLATKETKR